MLAKDIGKIPVYNIVRNGETKNICNTQFCGC